MYPTNNTFVISRSPDGVIVDPSGHEQGFQNEKKCQEEILK